MRNEPLVSVVIPTYNYASYLPKALTSCLSQTYQNIEIIVVDDDSTDGTRELLHQYGDRVRYVHQEHKGASAARNKGLSLARGEFINFLDADDYFTDDSIEVRLQILSKDHEIGAVISGSYRERESSVGTKPITTFKPKVKQDTMSEKFYEDLLLQRISFATCTALIRSSLAKRFKFPVNITNGEDIAYFTKIFFCTKGYYLARPTAVVFKHPASLRHDIEKIGSQGVALVDTVLDDNFYEGKLEYLRPEFMSMTYLSLSRSFYRAADKKRARKYYIAGIKHKPSNILQLNSLTKFLRSFF